MAKITLPSYLKSGNGRMDDAVLANWRGIVYMKPYRKPKNAQSGGQIAVRAAFSSLVTDWKALGGIIRTSWNASVEGQPLTGYNAFIGVNSGHRRKGEHLDLCPPMGEDQVTNFSAAAGGAAGSIACSFAPLAAGKHLTLFIRKSAAAQEETGIIRQDCGAGPVSPVTVPNLETGASYTVYALATDAAYAEAKTVSNSVAATASAA